MNGCRGTVKVHCHHYFLYCPQTEVSTRHVTWQVTEAFCKKKTCFDKALQWDRLLCTTFWYQGDMSFALCRLAKGVQKSSGVNVFTIASVNSTLSTPWEVKIAGFIATRFLLWFSLVLVQVNKSIYRPQRNELGEVLIMHDNVCLTTNGWA